MTSAYLNLFLLTKTDFFGTLAFEISTRFLTTKFRSILIRNWLCQLAFLWNCQPNLIKLWKTPDCHLRKSMKILISIRMWPNQPCKLFENSIFWCCHMTGLLCSCMSPYQWVFLQHENLILVRPRINVELFLSSTTKPLIFQYHIFLILFVS